MFLACRPIDLRNGFDGLVAKAQQLIGADPFSGPLFLFRGKRGDYFKGLYWDGSGLNRPLVMAARIGRIAAPAPARTDT